MDRTRFYNRTNIRGTEEFDYLYNNLSNFKITYTPAQYRIIQSDLLRPDLISYKNYSTISYWWLICYVNEIHDPLRELEVGEVLSIPNILDIFDFYRKFRMR